ncbi:hypothetical protein KDK95_09715 [Actinospica sp. MGRD01-02]|uniref:Dihydrofolate reductase n=1 Tax=Actinospica acidithermotolerans TaxID=2828514 RepID=A0A941E5A6_9ACTN|nr:hypothetical protein [Actinospica acidithermotolerans]MBR7826580.1 hypothetical protein [Actinospica acidithermotolerans]
MRTLAITQNITVDGSIEMLDDWFDPQGQGGEDPSDLMVAGGGCSPTGTSCRGCGRSRRSRSGAGSRTRATRRSNNPLRLSRGVHSV